MCFSALSLSKTLRRGGEKSPLHSSSEPGLGTKNTSPMLQENDCQSLDTPKLHDEPKATGLQVIVC